jgi:hypothetical protein
MRRTKVRPMGNRRAIADLLRPARSSFRIGHSDDVGTGDYYSNGAVPRISWRIGLQSRSSDCT